MKLKTLIIPLTLLFLLISIASLSLAQDKQTGPLAEAVFPKPVYEFPAVVEGLKVKHDFIVQNHGKAELKIFKVRTG